MGHVANLLESRGEKIIDATLRLDIEDCLLKGSETIYFHQPFSHLCALLFALRHFVHRHQLCCILHEACNYNFGVTSTWRAIIGAFARFAVIRLCRLVGIRVEGVSAYVCSSYLLQVKTVSYLHLFRDCLERHADAYKKGNGGTVIWLRRGGSELSLKYLRCLIQASNAGPISVLGDPVECDMFLDTLLTGKLAGQVAILKTPYKLKEEDFFQLLKNARWFITTFSREGFGLSAFQAAYFGCVVLGPKKGALQEWLPPENFIILNKLIDGGISRAEVGAVSEINMRFGRNLLNEN